jgi:hypothetical protein
MGRQLPECGRGVEAASSVSCYQFCPAPSPKRREVGAAACGPRWIR